MKIVGISGSKGKTTIAYLLHLYLDSINKSNLLYSSLDFEIAVPNNVRLNAILEEAKEKNVEYLILEINEEYIDKIDKNVFDYKVLTNVSVITEKEKYNEYKNKLLSFYDNTSINVLCYSPEIEKEEYLNFIGRIQNKTLFGSSYDTSVYEIDKNLFYSLIFNNNEQVDNINEIKFYILSEGRELLIKSKMMFDFSAYNINCLYALINTLKIYKEEVFIKAIDSPVIPGRCEKIIFRDRTILITLSIVDILESLYNYKEHGYINNIILVIGSIGIGHDTWSEEFNTKEQEVKLSRAREYACSYASNYCDYIYLTSSDPASTDPLKIANEMETYLIESKFYKTKIEINREKAIEDAIIDSNAGDVIIISGRGNRSKYVKNNIEYNFSDYQLIQRAIKKIGK